MDSWNNLHLTCSVDADCYAGSPLSATPRLYCGQNLLNSCQFMLNVSAPELSVVNEWRCIGENKVCDDLSTSNPTVHPTLDPTIDPTKDPTKNPTDNPTAEPTSDPTLDPTLDPTTEPTQEPTIEPTNAPSISPSFSPSNDPTRSPTQSPSFSPSQSPTRRPTALSQYDSFMDIIFVIREISYNEIKSLTEKNGKYKFNETMNVDIVNMIESAYVNLDWTLEFRQFYVRIEYVNGESVSELSEDEEPDMTLTDHCARNPYACTLKLKSKLFCGSAICGYIFHQFSVYETDFETAMTVDIFEYVHPNETISENDELYFAVDGMEKPRLINPTDPKWFTQFENWIIIFVGIVIIIIVVMIFYFKHRIKKMRSMKAFIVQNPLVLLVSIGDYEPDIVNVQRNEIYVHIPDLPGIENDVLNMNKLFGNGFGYDVFPELNGNEVRIKWNERDFKEFIEERARYLLNNIDDGKKYDSMILIISCHGIPDYLLMSDYRKYSKLAVQRTFSFWPKLREIPRFILYDCCSGHQGREVTMNVHTHIDDGNVEAVSQKKIEEQDIFDGIKDKKLWVDDDQNPDHLLARVNAANAGFTSNLNRRTGSYLITKMYDKYMDALDGQRSPFPFIHEVFDEIQTELQEEGRQLPESVWNDNTRYLLFKKRSSAFDESNIIDKNVKTEVALAEVIDTHSRNAA